MFSFFQSITITILLAFLLRFFAIQPFIVEGSSMEPSFHNQEYIIIDKASYRFREPKRGEVVVFHPPTNPTENYIKRIIGLPGDTIRIDGGEVFVNNNKINEPYLGDQNHQTEAIHQNEPITLPPGQYYVMGDNRGHSSDSREWGELPKQSIEGRTWFIALPIQNFQFIPLPSYNTIDAINTGVIHPNSAEANG